MVVVVELSFFTLVTNQPPNGERAGRRIQKKGKNVQPFCLIIRGSSTRRPAVGWNQRADLTRLRIIMIFFEKEFNNLFHSSTGTALTITIFRDFQTREKIPFCFLPARKRQWNSTLTPLRVF